jgi:hypothetical protein
MSSITSVSIVGTFCLFHYTSAILPSLTNGHRVVRFEADIY